MKSEFIYREALDYLARNKREKGEKLLIKAANKGYVEAILLLARKYADGIDFGHDHERALVWLKKAAETGDLPSTYRCAEFDPDHSFYWHERAAKMGHLGGIRKVAEHYKNGYDDGPDLEKAFYWYGIGAEKGDSDCMYEYAMMYKNGEGTPEDPAKAFYWMQKVPKGYNHKARYELAKMLYEGKGCTRDLKTASDEMGHIAQFKYSYKDSKELSKKYFFAYQQELAESGDEEEKTRAWYELGRCYEEGEGTEQDYAKAANYYKKISKALFSDPDIPFAIMTPEYYAFLTKDRKLGCEKQAQMRLANLYYEGKGVEQDDLKAFYFYEIAARLGDKDARNMAETVGQKIWDLKEGNVDRIFEDCVENRNMDENLCVEYELFDQKHQEADRRKVRFNLAKIKIYSSIIRYFFGQLKAFHSNMSQVMSFTDGMIDYQNNAWTNDTNSLIKLYALGIASEYISRFFILENETIAAKRNPHIIPTYFTSDPRYSEWYKNEYKSENKSIDDFFTVFGTVYSRHDVSYKHLQAVLFYFWNQPPESRERIMKQIQEKVSEAKNIPEERKTEFLAKEGSMMLEMAEAHDMVRYLACQHPDQFPEEHVNGIFNGLGPELQEIVTDMKKQGTDYTTILNVVETEVEHLVTREMLEIAAKAFGVAEE